MAHPADRILDQLQSMGSVRKCSLVKAKSTERAKNPELTAEQLMAKRDFDAKIKALEWSNYEAAELFETTEGCIRAWRDEEDMKRHPPSYGARWLQKIIEARSTLGALRGVGT